MPKQSQSLYICSYCGYQTAKWLGRCPECDQWNSFLEETLHKNKLTKKISQKIKNIKTLDAISLKKEHRIKSTIKEFDRIMGGGIVPGSMTLISGEPGIGKSTLLLQIANGFSKSGKTLYISAEESAEQVKLRSDRLNLKSNSLYISEETDIYMIQIAINKIKPTVVIIDSIQTVNHPDITSVSGSISQIRECSGIIIEQARKNNTAVFIVGHVTKEGSIAGPKILEHMVDAVLYMEGDKNLYFRILKCQKNRFGSTSEIAVFEMTLNGLNPVNNPSSYFIDRYKDQLPGSAIVVVMEGTRPILVELQSLVSPTTMAYPRRISEGADYNKVLLIGAILEKILGLQLNNQEIYLKIAGGLKINEPSIDLGIAASIISSYKNKSLAKGSVLIGEIGLTGEIKPVPYIEQRLQEVENLGFNKVFLPKANLRKNMKKYQNLELLSVEYIKELYQYLNQK